MRQGPLKLGILGSGKGSNLDAIVHAISEGSLDAEIRLVVSDLPGSPILEKARAHGLSSEVLPLSRYRTRLEPEIERNLASLLEEADVELLVLAGYMRMVKAPLLERFRGRIVNIHPSLLPEFPGLEAWRQALDAGVPFTGCTVHWVDEGMDTGAIIAQSKVGVEAGDTAESLHERIQIAERVLYPTVLSGLSVQFRRSRIDTDIV
jgi:phosphoribosylglycinamide formyltransferase-1